MNRRTLLKRGLWGGALLALGGSGFLLSRRTERIALGGLMVLDPIEASVLHALALRLIPAAPGFPSVDELRVVQRADQILAMADSGAQRELRQLLKLFENALTNFLFGARSRPFTRLSPEDQDQVIAEWRDSRVTLRRSGYQALRTLILAAYYSSEKIWPAVGYLGPPEGFYQPQAQVWTGIGARPESNGIFHPSGPDE